MGFMDFADPLGITGQGGGGLEALQLAGGAFTGGMNRAKSAEKAYGGVDPTGQYGAVAGEGRQFGQTGAMNYGLTGLEAGQAREMLRRQATGQDSISAEQLRQGMMANQNMQQSFAAGAAPSNSAMAARQASNNAARIGGGLAGQQAMAGIAERNAAAGQLNQAILAARQQDLNAALGGQQNALAGYGGIEQQRTQRYGAMMGAPTPTEQMVGMVGGGFGAAAMSDRRAKKNIREGDKEARDFIRALKAYRYEYIDEADGKGELVGIMTDDLKRSKAGRAAVVDTPRGEMVDGARLATVLAATLPGLDRRLRKVERTGK